MNKVKWSFEVYNLIMEAVDMENDTNAKMTEIKNIKEMIGALCWCDRYQIIDMLKSEIEELKKNLKVEKNKEKAELLKLKLELLRKGIVVYSDYFYEECIYLIDYIRRGEVCR